MSYVNSNPDFKRKSIERGYSKENLELLSKIGRKIDEDTPFRYLFQHIKQRAIKEVFIDINYLKKVWENQKGICPYTGLQLTLPTHVTYKKIHIIILNSPNSNIKRNIFI